MTTKRERGLTAQQVTELIDALQRQIAHHRQKEEAGRQLALSAAFDSKESRDGSFDRIYHAGAADGLDYALTRLRTKAGRE